MLLYVDRQLETELEKDAPPRAVLLYGPRRIGKTSLLEHLVGSASRRWFNGDMPGTARELDFQTQGDVLNALLQDKCIVIDEAHKIPDIGNIVKMLVDVNERLEEPRRIYITSSSAFYLSAVQESALGRVVSRKMWPFSLREIASCSGWGPVLEKIDHHIVYGLMPCVYLQPEQARAYLTDYCDGFLLRDFLDENPIKHPAKLRHLLQLLALSVGSEVSYDNLSREIGLNRMTVEDYIERLQRSSLICVCPSFSRNQANELKKGKKIYFFDNGVRNAIIGNFSPLSNRTDAGALWENFFFTERVKLHDTLRDFKQMYFWRTSGSTPREIDFIEVVDDRIEAFECKLSLAGKPSKHAQAFLKTYPQASFRIVQPKDCFAIFGQSGSKAM